MAAPKAFVDPDMKVLKEEEAKEKKKQKPTAADSSVPENARSSLQRHGQSVATQVPWNGAAITSKGKGQNKAREAGRQAAKKWLAELGA